MNRFLRIAAVVLGWMAWPLSNGCTADPQPRTYMDPGDLLLPAEPSDVTSERNKWCVETLELFAEREREWGPAGMHPNTLRAYRAVKPKIGRLSYLECELQRITRTARALYEESKKIATMPKSDEAIRALYSNQERVVRIRKLHEVLWEELESLQDEVDEDIGGMKRISD